MNHWIKTIRSVDSVFFWRRTKFWQRDFSSALEKRKKKISKVKKSKRGQKVILGVAKLLEKKMSFHAQKFTGFLSNDCVLVSSHAFWRVLPNEVIWVFGCWVNIPHTHTSECDLYCLEAACIPPSRLRRVSWIMLIEAILFNVLDQFALALSQV